MGVLKEGLAQLQAFVVEVVEALDNARPVEALVDVAWAGLQ